MTISRTIRRAITLLSASFLFASGALAVSGSGAVAASGGWAKLNSGVTANLHSVTLGYPPSTIWAVGDGGTIIHSTNSGNTFTQVASGTTRNLYGVGLAPFCGNGPCIYVAGEGGTLRVSNDDGATWCDAQKSASTGTVRLGGHFWNFGPFIVEVVGFGGTVLEGGDATQGCPSPAKAIMNKQDSGTTKDLYSFSGAINSTYNWASGATGTVLAQRFEQTSSTCNPSNPNPVPAYDVQSTGTTADLRGIAQGDGSDVFAVGTGGTITHTPFKDGDYKDPKGCAPLKANWALEASGTTKDLNDVAVYTDFSTHKPAQEFVVGAAGTILTSTNTTTWTSQVSGVCANLNSVAIGETDTRSGNSTVSTLTAAYAVGDAGTVLKYNPAAAAAPVNGCQPVTSAVLPALPKAGVAPGQPAWLLMAGGLVLVIALAGAAFGVATRRKAS